MKQIFYSLLFLISLTATTTAQLSEDFESGFPATWTKDNVWVHGTGSGLSSQYFNIPNHTMIMAVNDDGAGPNGNSNGRIVTPEVDLTGIEYPFLRFEYYFLDGDYQGDDEQVNILVSKDAGTTWDAIRSLPSSNWSETYISLKDYIGETVLVAIEYVDGGGWNYGVAVDNVEIIDYRVFSDIEFVQAVVECTHAVPGAEFQFEVSLRNKANQNLTGFDVQITGNGETQMHTVEGIDVETYDRYYTAIPITIAMGTDDIDFSVEVTNLSTGDDEDGSNNTLELSTVAVSPQAKSAVVVEEATGTWCTWCPRGAVFMDRATQCFKEHFVGIAVHNEDPMAFAEYDDGVTNFPGFSGFPSVIFNRNQVLDPADIFQPIANAIVLPPFAEIDIDIDLDADTRQLNVTATGVFNQPVATAGYRWNAVLVEDGVTGTSSSWRQVNAYAGGTYGLMGGYENLPGLVPAQQMVYDHVARALLAGFEGAAGSIESGLAVGDTSTFSFNSYTIPTTYDIENLKVAVMIHNSQGRIVAAGETDVTMSTPVLYVDDKEVNWSVAPNPMSDRAQVTVTLPESGSLQLSMVDMLGKVVSLDRYQQSQGTMIYEIDSQSMPAGIYSLVLTYNGVNSVQKVVVQ